MQLGAHRCLCHTCAVYCKNGLRSLSFSAAHRSAVNHYEVLGVKPTASLEEIKNAFFDKSKKLHPDSDPTNPGLHSQFVALNEAYRVLSREHTRKEYDLRMRHQPTAQHPFGSASTYPYGRSASGEQAERTRYWEQFYWAQPRQSPAEQQQRQHRQNKRLVGYCLFAMFASVCIHYLGFRKLEEVHTNFMDEKDRAISQIYNESKERARINSFQKQTEILRQKHAEFQEKYKLRKGGGGQ